MSYLSNTKKKSLATSHEKKTHFPPTLFYYREEIDDFCYEQLFRITNVA